MSSHCASSHSFNWYCQNKNHTRLKNPYEHTKSIVTKPSVLGHVELSNKTNVAFHFQIRAYWLFYLLCCRVCQKALLWRQVAMKRDKNFISARRCIALLWEKLHSSPMRKNHTNEWGLTKSRKKPAAAIKLINAERDLKDTRNDA